MTIRVLVADDQELIRAGFAAIVDSADDMEIIGQAVDGTDALRQVRARRPDVVLMDIRMPVQDGISACDAISNDPELSDVRVLILTTFEQDDNVVSAVAAGASAFLGKGCSPQDLLHAIRVVFAGDALLSPKATMAVLKRMLDQSTTRVATDSASVDLSRLTEREREIVTLVATGLSNAEMAERLHLSPWTVKTHVNRSMTKLGARDRAQLVVFAYRSGLAP